jgi:hypothetical protein
MLFMLVPDVSSISLTPIMFGSSHVLRALLERKKGSKSAEKGKGKFTEAEVEAMQSMD